MGIFRGPNIVTDNLVFGYDTGYGIADNTTATRFYPGEPSDNLLYKTGASNLATGGDIYVNSTKTSLGNGKYKWVNDGTGGTTIRIYCNLSDLTNGESYAISLFYEGLVGSVSLDWCDTSITGYSNTNGKITGIGTRATYTSTYRFLDINLSTGGSVVLYNPQIERKSHTTPFVDGIRSDTASLIDLKRTTSIDVSNVSFDSTGQPTFDGTSDRIVATPSSAITFSDQLTFDVWIYPMDYTASGGNRQYLIDPRGDGNTSGMSAYFLFDYMSSPDTVRITAGNSNIEVLSSNFSMPLNTWHNIVATRNGNSWVIYHNGISISTGTTNTTSLTLNNAFRIGTYANGSSGQYFFEGKMAVAKMYNQGLSATQVLQNYNAYKNRFNI